MDGNKRVVLSWNVLRFAYGLVLVLAGLDKLLGTDLIVAWPKYISPFVGAHLPVSVAIFLAFMGVVEIAVGIMLMTKWPRIGGFLSVAWLAIIAVNLMMLGYLDIAIRDLLLAVGAYVMAELTVAVEELKLVGQTM